jgi:hypothetical protein
MGNSCSCENIHFVRDVKLNVCFEKMEIAPKSDQVLYNDGNKIIINLNEKKNKDNLTQKKMNEILNYFNEGEREIINSIKKKNKAKKVQNKKKTNDLIDNNNRDDNKYELILKRLLEQQNIKKIGPKRRETIRKEGDNLKDIVKDLLKENKNIALNKKNSIESNSLLIKTQFNKKGRFSVTVDKKSLMDNINHNNKKKFQEQYLNNRMTICEVITESNGGLAKQNSNES